MGRLEGLFSVLPIALGLEMNKTVRSLIQSLKDAGYPMETYTFTKKESAYHRKLDKQVQKFLEEKYRSQKRSEKCKMVFKLKETYV